MWGIWEIFFGRSCIYGLNNYCINIDQIWILGDKRCKLEDTKKNFGKELNNY